MPSLTLFCYSLQAGVLTPETLQSFCPAYYLSHCYTIAWDRLSNQFLSRVSILLLTRDIDIVILSVCPSVRLSVRDTLVLYENGLTYRHSFSTIR